jgi:hypothetical protein
MTPVLGPALSIAFGAGFLLLSIRALSRARGSTRWPSAPGRVTAFDETPTRLSGSKADALRVFAFGPPKPGVVYSYEVSGVKYEGSTISYGPDLDDDRNVQRAVRYIVGSGIRVFYNPDRPSEAVLETGVTRLVYDQVILALALVAFGIYLLVE